MVKNKVAAPFKAVNLDILFGKGIDSVGCTVDAAEELGVVERKGSWYSYQGENLAQGRLNVAELLKNDETLAQEIESKVRQALIGADSVDDDAVEDSQEDTEVDVDETELATEESDIFE